MRGVGSVTGNPRAECCGSGIGLTIRTNAHVVSVREVDRVSSSETVGATVPDSVKERETVDDCDSVNSCVDVEEGEMPETVKD